MHNQRNRDLWHNCKRNKKQQTRNKQTPPKCKQKDLAQWVLQSKEALKSYTMGAVWIAIIQSVRGEVREFVAAIGFEGSAETLLPKVEDRFGEKWTSDRL